MALRLRVGRKGYIILPKAVRDVFGIDEGDELIVGIRDGIVLKPAKRGVDIEKLRESLRRHTEKLAASLKEESSDLVNWRKHILRRGLRGEGLYRFSTLHKLTVIICRILYVTVG